MGIVYHVAPLLSLNLIFPTKLSPMDIIAQKDKPLQWIYSHYKGHQTLTAYLNLLAQLLNQIKTQCQ